MGLRVNTNVLSLNSQRNLANTTDQLGRSMERLSSGLRITRASDDAAGLAISERFRADIRSLSQAQRNANDGISLLQVAEGALNESSGILIRMRELAVQASNGTLGAGELGTLDQEFQSLLGELDRIAAVTEFNGVQVLDGTAGAIIFQVGGNNSANDIITVNGVDATTGAAGLNVTGDLLSLGNANTALDTLDASINTLSGLRADFGTAQNVLESTIRSIAVAVENTSAAESRIRDVDVASETAMLTRNQVLQQAGVAMLAQANQSSAIALSLLQ